MNASFDVLFEIAWRFASLSLLAIGGINALLPEFHRVVVDVEGWMTSAEFADLFALAQLAPGPNAMVVSLLGWKVAGVAGASAAAAGLIIGTAIRLITGSRPPLRALLLATGVFVAVGIAQAPLLWVLAVAVPLAIAVEWRAPR